MDKTKSYTELEDAMTSLDAEIRRLEKEFCPVVGGSCRINCVCLKKPEIITTGSKLHATYLLVLGRCRNKMLFTPSLID